MKLQAYARLTPAKQAEFRKEWVSVSKKPPNGQLTAVEAKLRAFEHRYEMSTETMRAKFKTGELKDTADISQWLILSKISRGTP
jgi:hypothetical protein